MMSQMPLVICCLFALLLSHYVVLGFVTPKKCPSCHRIHPSPIATFPDESRDTVLAMFRSKKKSADTEDLVNDFCVTTNEFCKGLVIPPVTDYVQMQPAGTAGKDPLSKLIAPPELPGIPRPVWLTMLGSIPTGLLWYAYYKFAVEEELFQYELEKDGKVSGCGGFGTMLPFIYGLIVGVPLQIIHFPGGGSLVEAASLWFVLGQINLYRRVNDICSDLPEIGEKPLYEWWVILPPPLNLVVNLRQVHFLSEFWTTKRGEEKEKDIVAEDLFPFISAPRFTLKKFFRTPSMWFWFTKEWKDFDYDFLQD